MTFIPSILLTDKFGALSICWYASILSEAEFKKKWKRTKVDEIKITKQCKYIIFQIEKVNFNLYLLGQLRHGVIKIHFYQTSYLLYDCKKLIEQLLAPNKQKKKQKETDDLPEWVFAADNALDINVAARFNKAFLTSQFLEPSNKDISFSNMYEMMDYRGLNFEAIRDPNRIIEDDTLNLPTRNPFGNRYVNLDINGSFFEKDWVNGQQQSTIRAEETVDDQWGHEFSIIQDLVSRRKRTSAVTIDAGTPTKRKRITIEEKLSQSPKIRVSEHIVTADPPVIHIPDKNLTSELSVFEQDLQGNDTIAPILLPEKDIQEVTPLQPEISTDTRQISSTKRPKRAMLINDQKSLKIPDQNYDELLNHKMKQLLLDDPPPSNMNNDINVIFIKYKIDVDMPIDTYLIMADDIKDSMVCESQWLSNKQKYKNKSFPTRQSVIREYDTSIPKLNETYVVDPINRSKSKTPEITDLEGTTNAEYRPEIGVPDDFPLQQPVLPEISSVDEIIANTTHVLSTVAEDIAPNDLLLKQTTYETNQSMWTPDQLFLMLEEFWMEKPEVMFEEVFPIPITKKSSCANGFISLLVLHQQLKAKAEQSELYGMITIKRGIVV